jgi:predicted O-methyltransferase YrrM
MYSKFQIGLKYFQYSLAAANSKGHGIHSPFVFDFVTKILNDKEEHGAYEKPEALRQKLMQDQTLLRIEDLGAGSSVSASMQRSVASIAKHVVKPKKYGQVLHRIVTYYQPKIIIELGTSLGITTGYLSLANPSSTIFTMEGSSAIAEIARQNFKTLECHNIKLIEGNFDYTLPAVLYQVPTVDLAFIDGNHRRQPTENYFHQVLEKINDNSILVFDDIHWSREMEQAWQHIKEHRAVRCTIDLFFIGIVLFRKEFREKQDFQIRF